MANSYTVLANLKAGRCSNTAKVRLLRFWDAKNITKGGKLIRLEMLLIDEQSEGLSAQLDNELPKFIVDIVGKSYTFQLKLGEFSFTAKHQTFTISRIITECQRRLLPEFVIDVGIAKLKNKNDSTQKL